MKFDINTKRKELGLTLEEIAKYVGVSKSTVKKWESGYIKNMRRDKIKKLAAILDVSPIDILQSGDAYPTPEPVNVQLTAPLEKQLSELLKSAFNAPLNQNCTLILKDNKLFFLPESSSIAPL
ncbi:MAG: helix-turn-helix transcriptional regulator [Clostridia bacterium]|nr:helix-turn-helix transcriptional regulator [Clostridia bacterium]